MESRPKNQNEQQKATYERWLTSTAMKNQKQQQRATKSNKNQSKHRVENIEIGNKEPKRVTNSKETPNGNQA